MKYSRARLYAFLVAVFFTGTVNAAGVPVWLPKGANIATIELDLGQFIGLGRDFAIFDATDLGTFANPLALNTGAIGRASISTVNNNDGTWTFTNTRTTGTLSIGDPGAFVFGHSADIGATWSAEAASWTQVFPSLFPDIWSIKYAYGTDVKTAYLLVKNVSPVPVPAAVWLFGSGLIGLAGVARRRRKQLETAITLSKT